MTDKAFIFDLDGTILFLTANWDRVRSRLVDLYRSYGIEINRSGITNIFRSIDETGDKIDNTSKKEEFRVKAFSVIKEEEIKGAVNSYFREGADLLIYYLKGQNLAIVSSNSREAAEIAFKTVGVDSSIFKSMVMRDDVTRLKPNPQGIIKAINELRDYKDDLKEFYYIGDQKNDVIAAKEASKSLDNDEISIKTIAVCGGASKEEKIRAQNPDYFTYSMVEVKNVIEEILK